MSDAPSARAGLTMLVDTSSLVYRAWFAVPDTVRTPDGKPVNGAYGFLNMLARLIGTYRPAFLACALDDDWRPQWRVDLIDSYKAHRVADGDYDQEGEQLEEQLLWIDEILQMAGIATFGAEGWEAEDVIGSLAACAPGDVAIVSGDRDLFQLVRDPDVWILYPKRGVSELTRVDETEIATKYGIPGRLYADFAILRGDPSDGLPGVRGIGEKSAAMLVSKYGRVEDVLRAAAGATSGPLAKIAAAADYVERAARVVRITDEAPVGEHPVLRLPLSDAAEDLLARAEHLGLGGPVRRLLATVRGEEDIP